MISTLSASFHVNLFFAETVIRIGAKAVRAEERFCSESHP